MAAITALAADSKTCGLYPQSLSSPTLSQPKKPAKRRRTLRPHLRLSKSRTPPGPFSPSRRGNPQRYHAFFGRQAVRIDFFGPLSQPPSGAFLGSTSLAGPWIGIALPRMGGDSANVPAAHDERAATGSAVTSAVREAANNINLCSFPEVLPDRHAFDHGLAYRLQHFLRGLTKERSLLRDERDLPVRSSRYQPAGGAAESGRWENTWRRHVAKESDCAGSITLFNRYSALVCRHSDETGRRRRER